MIEEPSINKLTNERHIVRNTALVSASFLLAAGMGLLRNIIIANTFGIGSDLDAFYATFKLPDLLFTIVAGGALATAFIPVFTEYLTTDDRNHAWKLASTITNLVVIVIGVLALLAMVTAPWLVRVVIAPGFEPALQAETAMLMRLVLLSTIFFGISAVQSSILHSFKHFLLPALAPIVYPLGIILGAIWLAPTMGVRGLAIGAVVGAIFHLLIKLPALIHYRVRWWPVLQLRDPAVRRVLLLMGPRVLDLGVFHITLLATTNLASRLDQGSVSAIEWGWEFMQLPETIIGTAFGLVAFPTLADLAARKDIDGLRTTLGNMLRLIITLTAPAAVGLILVGRPMLQLLYQRGAFDTAATDAVFVALSFFALGLVGHSCLELAARAFFALQDTVTPLLVAIGIGLLYVILSLGLMQVMGHGGLALANSIAITIEVALLLGLLRKRIGGVEGRETLRTIGLIGLACTVMALTIVVVQRLIDQPTSTVEQLFNLVVTVGTGVLVYGAVGWWLRIGAIRQIPQLLRVTSLKANS